MKQVSDTLATIAVNLYHELASNATLEEVEGKGTFTVFRGSLLAVYEKVSQSRSSYTNAYNLLKVTNCISVLNRGARANGSIVVLHAPPSHAELLQIDPELLLTRPEADAKLALEAQVKDLLASFRGMNIPEALANHEARIKELERQLKERKENAD